ncbi:response regulator [Chitinophaga sp. SYP-B3965]|uniref:ATP-binding protein n=1 Tax=Chitinophaga sp. SYP-B3965 TaxID=2663120 RepID=UPI0012995D4C|nr:ATP-binding protein [Chitinophaga sp. SYP-B3965]MRG44917.1 response regulator [Chitinophaga sp. SYP-B3965]
MSQRLRYGYILLAILVILLVSVVLFGFFKQQRIKQLNSSVNELAHTETNMERIDHAVQTMYEAENYFRFFTLTYQNVHFARYSKALQQLSADLDTLEAEGMKDKRLKDMLLDKENKASIFMKVKAATDSLLAMNQHWDTTKERAVLSPPAYAQFKEQVQIDTVFPDAGKPGKKRKLFGRVADAISNKQRDKIAPAIVKTTISTDARNNRQQLENINEYYSNLFRNITAGHTNLNQKEYEMIASNDQLLRTLLADLHVLKHERLEAAMQIRSALNNDISILLNKLNWETRYGAFLIILLAIAILVLIWYSYRNGLQLDQARNKAVRFSKLKSDFVASMSHEIRTPLGSVIGFSEQLGKTKLNQEQEDILDAINLSANMLLSVVNNVLDFSKLEENKLTLDNSIFSPKKIIEDIAKGMYIQAYRKEIKLETQCSFDKAVMVEGDEFRLKQVLFNLVGNAIKFTTEGSVTIKAGLQKQGDKMELSVAITDTGSGIDKQHIRHIFDEFTQVSSANDSHAREDGSGLGLTIVKSIIDLHGGKLHVDSVPGKGSTFSFSIPYTPAVTTGNDIPVTPADQPLPRMMNILVVDDNNMNRKVLEMILLKINTTFHSATNGVEALHLLEQHDFDLVFTDIQMPEMDGLTLARKIRLLKDRDKANLPIIAITGNAVKEDLDRYLDAGINSYILKPFREKEVLEMLRNELTQK